MSTKIILALTILAAGAVACSDSKKDTTPAQIGTGTTIVTSSGTGLTTGIDTGPATNTGTGAATNTGTGAATNTGTGVATNTGTGSANSTGTGVSTGTGAATGTGTGATTGTGAGTGTTVTPTKEGHLAIINAAPATGVTPVDVTGATPPTYDPDTKACK